MTRAMVFNNLVKLVGDKFDYDDVICAFEDFEECGQTEVIITQISTVPRKQYVAYINAVASTEFYITVDEDNIITDVDL